MVFERGIIEDIMNKVKKGLKIFCLIISCIVLIIIVSVVSNRIKLNNIKVYNQAYIKQYIKDNLNNCEIERLERSIYVPGFLDGGHDEIVKEDDVTKDYTETYYIYDKELDYNYTINFHHNAKERISMKSSKDRNYYRERKQKYEDNYKKIDKIIQNNGGKSELLSNYNEDTIGNYILLIYVPNVEIAKKIQEELYDNIYGGYYDEHLDETNNINITIPRYMFVNDDGIFKEIYKNKENVLEYTKYKDLECKDSTVNEYNKDNLIQMKDIVAKLFGKELDYERQSSNNTVLLVKDEELSNKWVITFELEMGISYYTDIYDIEE